MASALMRERNGGGMAHPRRKPAAPLLAFIAKWAPGNWGRALGLGAGEPAPPTEQLGQRAVRLGLATPAQVSVALSHQRERAHANAAPAPLGALMVQMGVLAPAQLAHLLSEVANGYQLYPDAIRLAASLQNIVTAGAQSVVVTGTRREDGAALLAAQVGLSLALMDRGPVTIVDGDRRRPSVEQLFGLPDLQDVRGTQLRKGPPTRDTGIPGLSVAHLGHTGDAGVSGLIGATNLELFEELRRLRRFNLVIAPPVTDHPETAIIAARADATLIVASAGVTRASDIAAVSRLLSAVNARVLGIVLTSRGR